MAKLNSAHRVTFPFPIKAEAPLFTPERLTLEHRSPRGHFTFHVAAHDVHVPELLREMGVKSDRQRQISERAESHQGDLWRTCFLPLVFSQRELLRSVPN